MATATQHQTRLVLCCAICGEQMSDEPPADCDTHGVETVDVPIWTGWSRPQLAAVDVTPAHAAALAAIMPASRLDYRWADSAGIGAAIDAVLAGAATEAQRGQVATACNARGIEGV